MSVITNTTSRRGQIRELLRLLGSEDEQLAYERKVPNVDITGELICMWFDDLYDAEHAEADPTFTESERAALASFHRLYEEHVPRLPKSQGTVRTWLATPIWREVMTEAGRALARVAA
jgi:hypothetical protein